eukprot:CAMPEP_0201542692 /NCGR_PEP_ID=MMETSP0161_2-20130828/72176_1 /ASSEMBLY_ACC=CAM_ASM_000251 /TAXON_ID=180227 /ORGANISM="Neoparamoeba aestuarina, Strain SoJaBio B1-5/56/2" /LENGTH=367 /DNA_ID=CAMNT_0047950367 /DNA_START=335 /DNA_END=1435 /DNA_ORIENTATION=-
MRTFGEGAFIGQPVIYLHGNAGSWRQVRSIASEISRRSKNTGTYFDFWAIDFHGEFGIVSGQTVEEQALFTNEVIRWVLDTYHNSPSSYNSKSVILIGHSLGGLVARLAPTLPNYVPNSIRNIITFASPHAESPLPFYPSMAHIYKSIDEKWSDYAATGPGGFLSDILVVSVAGGYRDHLVSSEKTELKKTKRGVAEGRGDRREGHVGECSQVISEVSTSVPGVWLQVDHDAMVWCNQLVSKIASLMYLLMEEPIHQDTLPLCHRSHRASHFLSNNFYALTTTTTTSTPTTTPTTLVRERVEMKKRDSMVVGVEEGGFGCKKGRWGETEGEEELLVLAIGDESKLLKFDGEVEGKGKMKGKGKRGGW